MSKAIFVQGLAYGDEGKGATVDFLCRQLPVDLVVRFNGGSQAAHNVVTPEGEHHTFSQFGSGSLVGHDVRTHLSRFMLVNPLNMMREAEDLSPKVHGNIWALTTVDPRCVVITPFHRQVNRLREQRRGAARHGTCGQGVGVAREWHLKYGDAVLLAGDVLDYAKTERKLQFLRSLLFQEFGSNHLEFGDYELGHLRYDYCSSWAEQVVLSELLPKSDLAVFEGAQGVLLDETHGEAPHHTWTDCTFANADTLCGEAGIMERFRIGCLRTYLTRHGHGPFEAFEAGSVPEAYNDANEWQGDFRTGPMRFDSIRKAIGHIGRLDCLALSHLDCCVAEGLPILEGFERGLHVPVGITAKGPTASDREFTPAWTGAWQRMAEMVGAR